MKKTPLLEHLFALKKSEMTTFRTWLTSPLTNSRNEVLALFDWLTKFEEEERNQITKEAAFKVIYPNKSFDIKRLRYIMSYLLQQIRQFLIWQALQKDTVQQQIYLLQQLRDRQLEKAFLKQLKKTDAFLESSLKRNHQYHFHFHQIRLEEFEFSYRYGRNAKIPLKAVTSTFTVYAIANLLKWYCNVVTHKSISDTAYDEAFLELVLTHVEQGEYEDVPAIQLYYKIYLALSKGSEKHYQALKDLSKRYLNLFPEIEIRDIILLIINFCIKKLNSGQTTFIKEAFYWYKKGLTTKVLIQNNELSQYTYNNVIIIALNLSEFEWTKQFMESHKKYINVEHRHDLYYYNLALWHQHQKQYDEVQKLLQKVIFKDTHHTIHAKRILLKIYYEKKEFKLLESLLESIRIYLYRHKKLGYHKENYLKLIRFTRKLVRLNLYDKNAKEQFKSEVEQEKSLLEKKWFLEMIG